MINSNYEDYMQNVLGYVPKYTYQANDSIYDPPIQRGFDEYSIEQLYPDIYKIVYPMIKKVCIKIGSVINDEIIEKYTNEIYAVLEEDDKKENSSLKRNVEAKPTNSSTTVKRSEETRYNNYLLKDLIRILILRELLGRYPGNRPPMMPPPPPPMPPMPPRPPRRPDNWS